MVVELDAGIAKRGNWISRSKLIAMAVRAFIDKGGLETLESRKHWPDPPEQSNSPD